MKNYTVKEIAKKCNTNEETVRRWIRSGKMKADQSSRRGGNIISEQNYKNFLEEFPKYATIASNPASIAGSAIGILAGNLIIALIEQRMNSKEFLNKAKIPASELLINIDELIKCSKKNISDKNEEIKKLQKEIAEEEQRIQKFVKLKKELKQEI